MHVHIYIYIHMYIIMILYINLFIRFPSRLVLRRLRRSGAHLHVLQQGVADSWQ